MGRRKLTVRDGDLARCCAAQGPIICEASLEVCFDAAASSLVGRVRRPQSVRAYMWSSTVQRSPRLRCRTALSQLPEMASRPVLS